MLCWARCLVGSIGVALLGCGSSASQDQVAVPDDAAGQVITVPGDAGFRIPTFTCDAEATHHDGSEPLDASSDVGVCMPTNSGVQFQMDVLPVFRGCSGELCHSPWTYRTTVNVTSTECCDERKIIDPGNPGGSYLVQKVRGVDLCGNSGKMGDLAPSVVQAIEDWICLGAPDN
jgi:hypothetical protein